MRETANKLKILYNAVYYSLHRTAQTGCNQNRQRGGRPRCTTEQEDKYISSSTGTSPPKTITLDDVMSSARDLSNLTLAHEIIVNRDFHVEQPHLPQNSLEKQVKDIVHKVFWDSLESEYEHVTLKGQITSITQENNPIRSLVEGRVQQYCRVLLATPNSHVNPPPTPGGLALIQPGLTSLAVTFVSLVNFNKQVYSPFYMMILKTLLFSNAAPPPAATTPQDPTIQNPVNSN
uniref:T-complex 11, testis-specific-like 2 n=1 Tax=Hucho hucho TaxID=62062 RepID=A0A4W5QSX5_9TELE